MTVLTNHLILIKYKVIKLKIKPKKHIKDKEDNRPKETEQRECTGAFSIYIYIFSPKEFVFSKTGAKLLLWPPNCQMKHMFIIMVTF